MSETSVGRVPVSDAITLRFDLTVKERLEELAAEIGPRCFGAVVRVAARRLVADPDRVPTALAQARGASAESRRITRAHRSLDLDPDTSNRLDRLAADHRTDRNAIVRVAIHRYPSTASRFRPALRREDARSDLTSRHRIQINPSALARLERIHDRTGKPLASAAIRVAVRRLLDDPGDLDADLATIATTYDLTPEQLGPRVTVSFDDDDLREQLTVLAAQFDSDRAELVRLATRQLLANPVDLDQAVTDEIHRRKANREALLAGNARRQTTAADQTTPAPAARKAPPPQTTPFGHRHVFWFDEHTRRGLEKLADEYGPRRMSALVRVGIRRLIGYPHADIALAQARRVAARNRALPHVPVVLKLETPTADRFHALAASYEASSRDLVAVAVHRFLAAPGRYRAALMKEADASQLDERITASVRPSARRDLEKLAARYGTRLNSAVVRVAVRRLLDDPGDLAGDLATIAPVHDLRPVRNTGRVDVALDDELLAHLDALAERLGSDRQELVYLAAKRILGLHGHIENRMLEDQFRAQKNRQELLTKHARREETRRSNHDGNA